MTRYAFYQLVITTLFFSHCLADCDDQFTNGTVIQSPQDEKDSDDDDDCEGQVGSWVGGKGRCFFSDDDFLYPRSSFIEDINRETGTWPGKREDPFYDNLTR